MSSPSWRCIDPEYAVKWPYVALSLDTPSLTVFVGDARAVSLLPHRRRLGVGNPTVGIVPERAAIVSSRMRLSGIEGSNTLFAAMDYTD